MGLILGVDPAEDVAHWLGVREMIARLEGILSM